MNTRAQCPLCTNDYATRNSLKRHLISTLHAKFDYRSDTVRILEGAELEQGLTALRRIQAHGSRNIPSSKISKISKVSTVKTSRSRREQSSTSAAEPTSSAAVLRVATHSSRHYTKQSVTTLAAIVARTGEEFGCCAVGHSVCYD